MLFLTKRKVHKILSILLVFTFFGANVLFSQELAPNKYFLSAALATNPMSSPMYKMVTNEDGKYDVRDVDKHDKSSIYTEFASAYAAHLAVYSFSDDSIERMEREADFHTSRIGYIQRIGNDVYAFYQKEDARDPEILLIKLSRFEEGEQRRTPGAIIELSDGIRVFVEVLTLDDLPEEHFPNKGEFSSMQDKDYREGFRMLNEVSRAVIDGGNPSRGVELLFTSAAFQSNNLNAFGHMCNRLIELASREPGKRGVFRIFLKMVIGDSVAFSEKSGASKAFQLMAGQALTAISWAERGIKGAEAIRINMEPEKMAHNEKHGWSYIDARSLPKDVGHVTEEGAPGFYWRGVELISTKLKGDKIRRRDLVFDKDLFGKADDTIMYTMNHGFLRVPDAIRSLTERGGVSTVHETVFINDFVPGSFQTTSTGTGHFQGRKIDVKQVTEGRGVQFNVKYDDEGKIVEVIAHEVSKFDWTFALPGYVDYVVNLGGLRFNDISIELDPEIAAKFNRGFDFSDSHIKKIGETVSKNSNAPYLGAVVGREEFIVKNIEDAPEVNWISREHAYKNAIMLTTLYSFLEEESVPIFISGIPEKHDRSISIPEAKVLSVLDRATLERGIAEGRAVPSMNMTNDMLKFIDENVDTILSVARDVVIRIPIEAIEAIGPVQVQEYLSMIQASPNLYIELYSKRNITEIEGDRYLEFGIEKKPLPEKTKKNTVTLFSVNKSEDISAKDLNSGRIGGIDPSDTILSPIGESYDRFGLARGLIFGLGLVQIANLKGEAQKEFTVKFLEKYKSFILSQGVRERDFNISEEDLLSLVTATINIVSNILRKVIKAIPIVPLNPSELKSIYDHATEALKRA